MSSEITHCKHIYHLNNIFHSFSCVVVEILLSRIIHNSLHVCVSMYMSNTHYIKDKVTPTELNQYYVNIHTHSRPFPVQRTPSFSSNLTNLTRSFNINYLHFSRMLADCEWFWPFPISKRPQFGRLISFKVFRARFTYIYLFIFDSSLLVQSFAPHIQTISVFFLHTQLSRITVFGILTIFFFLT